MRKEAWLAIAAGLTIGLIVAYGVARINSSFQHNFPQTVSGSPAPSPQSAENLQIALAKPETDAVVTTNPVIISGLTSPQTWVVILTQDKDYFLTSSANGEFASQITLAGGVNQIEAFGVNQKGQSTSQKIRLVFSSEYPPLPTPPEIPVNPRAEFGTVTDISGSSLQLKSDAGEIKQIATEPEKIGVVRLGKTNTNVKFSDIAIGDYVVTLGTLATNNGHVLNAKRILITSPQTPPKFRVYAGPVEEINKKEIKIKDLTFTTKLTGLKVGDFVIVAGEVDAKGEFIPRKSFRADSTPSPSPTANP